MSSTSQHQPAPDSPQDDFFLIAKELIHKDITILGEGRNTDTTGQRGTSISDFSSFLVSQKRTRTRFRFELQRLKHKVLAIFSPWQCSKIL